MLLSQSPASVDMTNNVAAPPDRLHLKCVATTTTTTTKGFNVSISGADDIGASCEKWRPQRNYFRSAEWTPDGTSIITNSADSQIRTFVLPPDLLEERHDPHELTAYSIVPAAEPVNAVAIYPMFDLQNLSVTLLLSSHRDHPIRLNSALTSQLVASYPLVNPTTEAFISPHSLLFTADGCRFLAGSESLLSIFDLSRPGEGPVNSFRTGRKKGSNSADTGMSMTGILSALAIDEHSGILAAGTFSRYVGLYDSRGQGDCVGVFCVEGTDADLQIGGSGVNQVIWSPCGRYLYIAERKSDGAMIYDIRKTGQLLAWLQGRKAVTNQRLGVHLASNLHTAHQEVWAGGTDGRLRSWSNPHKAEGAQRVTFEWQGHKDAVSATAPHPSAAVLASCSGAKRYADVHDDGEPEGMPSDPTNSTGLRTTRAVSDNSLKIWSLPKTQV